MDVHRTGLADVTPPPADRFAGWPRGAARLALAALALMLTLAAIAPGYAPPPPPPPQIAVLGANGAVVGQEDDNDVLLYRLVNARVRKGENYYQAAITEQRDHHYPVVPGFTVRLPTLTMADWLLGGNGMIALSLVLFAAMLLAMQRRLEIEPGGRDRIPLALGLLMAGVASGLDYKFNVLHEIWAGQLMVLSLALHRPAASTAWRRWGPAWLVAVLALAVRELVLPYVMLMGSLALWHRRRGEAAAWLGLIVVFAGAMMLHLHFASAPVRPGDPVSPSWIDIRGLAGLFYKINHSTFLKLLPLWISGPCVMLCLFGWAGWNTALGRCGFLLTAGYAVAFMIAGRDNNFYWGLLLAPLLFMGAVFAPQSLLSLWRSADLAGLRRQDAHA